MRVEIKFAIQNDWLLNHNKKSAYEYKITIYIFLDFYLDIR